MHNKEVSNITLEIGDMIETYDLTDSNNPVIELKDTVTENANAGTEQHVFKETTADGHENQISDFLIAQKQISALRTNSTGDGLVMESYDQKATHQQTDLRLAQVTTNKNNIATAQSDIRGLQTSVSQAEEDITNAQTAIDNLSPTSLIINTTLQYFGFVASNGTELQLLLPLNIPNDRKFVSLKIRSGYGTSGGQFHSISNATLSRSQIFNQNRLLQLVLENDIAFPGNNTICGFIQGELVFSE